MQGIAEAHDRIEPRARLAAIAADAGVARLLLARDLPLAQRIQLRLGAVAVVGSARLQHAANDLAVTIETLRLVVRPLVRVEPEPGHALENNPHRLRGGALAVGVLDPQDEPAARAPCVQPAEQRRARAADVQQPGGTGRKARDDRHGDLPTCPQLCGARMLPRAAAVRLARVPARFHVGAGPRFAFALGPPIDFRSSKWAVSSAVEHCFHTAGATGSIPVPPTINRRDHSDVNYSGPKPAECATSRSSSSTSRMRSRSTQSSSPIARVHSCSVTAASTSLRRTVRARPSARRAAPQEAPQSSGARAPSRRGAQDSAAAVPGCAWQIQNLGARY